MRLLFAILALGALLLASFAEYADAGRGPGGHSARRGHAVQRHHGGPRRPHYQGRHFGGRHKYGGHHWKGHRGSKYQSHNGRRKPYHRGHQYSKRGREQGGRGGGRGYNYSKKYTIDRGYGGSSGGSSASVDVSAIMYAISAFASENPGYRGTRAYHDSGTGQTVQFDHGECNCGADVEKIYAQLKAVCEEQGGTWQGRAKTVKDACLLPPPQK